MKVVAIVQARMSSTRLPGKVLRDIVGRPMLWHIINRLKYTRLIDKMVIATSDDEGDKPIMKFAWENGIDCYAGSELDLIDRLYQAARRFEADIAVKVTGDSPLIDPVVVDKVVKYYLDNKDKFDCVGNFKPSTYPQGLGAAVFSFEVIEKAWQEVKDPFWREWATMNFFDHPEKYRLGNVENDQDLSHMRWTVDYQEDLDFITEIYKSLYEEGGVFLMEDVLELLARNPGIASTPRLRNEAYYQALSRYKER
ncbi:MAG: glycosyltransferase family protein [Dehalococcoidales bacterium]|nr:glycosyltransferase family protein [Dehalococcoidales bacterium]